MVTNSGQKLDTWSVERRNGRKIISRESVPTRSYDRSKRRLTGSSSISHRTWKRYDPVPTTAGAATIPINCPACGKRHYIAVSVRTAADMIEYLAAHHIHEPVCPQTVADMARKGPLT